MKEYLEFAKKIAHQAGQIIQDNFEQEFESQIKSDSTPVTEIDQQINQLTLETIKSHFPSHGFLGEEGQDSAGNEEYQWLCDPIDATKAFILGIPTSVYMLGLMQDGEIQLSVVYDPYTGRLYHATRGGGAYCNNQPIHVNDRQMVDSYVLLGESNVLKFGEAVQGAGAQVEVVPGTGYKCMMIASGHGSGLIKVDASRWDVGPGSLIVEEAGGKVTDISGQKMLYDRELNGAIISNSVIHQDLIKIVLDNN